MLSAARSALALLTPSERLSYGGLVAARAIVGFLEGLTIWHWVGLGVVLLAIEVAVGTFDLLWVAAGAFLTALFALK